jgi:hypothetical protein
MYKWFHGPFLAIFLWAANQVKCAPDIFHFLTYQIVAHDYSFLFNQISSLTMNTKSQQLTAIAMMFGKISLIGFREAA